MKIGLFYGSTTCYTEMAAEKIQAALGDDLVELNNIKEVSLSNCLNYDILILGISTWDYGELQEDWESNWQQVANLNLSDKIVALYGMGDQVGYPQWFQDALGMLHDELTPTGCHFIGYWPNKGYQFTASKALTADGKYFLGLAIDDENQYQQTEERIEQWTSQLLAEIEEIIAA